MLSREGRAEPVAGGSPRRTARLLKIDEEDLDLVPYGYGHGAVGPVAMAQLELRSCPVCLDEGVGCGRHLRGIVLRPASVGDHDARPLDGSEIGRCCGLLVLVAAATRKQRENQKRSDGSTHAWDATTGVCSAAMAPALRPVPFRPPGPVDPEEAARHVGRALPELDEEARRALALVEVAGRPRDAVAAELSLGPDVLADALHRGRKALRRSVFPLSATGWCQRAERLLSDRLDDALPAPGPARLDAHLRHCGRCVEHERRLAQARDALVREYAELHGEPEPEPEPEEELPAPPPAELRIVPDAGLPALEPPPEPAAVEPPAAPEPAPEPAPVERVVVGVAAQGSRIWSALYATGIVLAIVSVLLTVLAATGAVERVF